MSKYSDQFIQQYGKVGNIKKATSTIKELKELEKGKKQDIKKKVKQMLRN